MRALSLWQPWASLIADGRKTIETRHWPTSYRGPLAIHAAQGLDRIACREFGYDWQTITRGAILCVVDVRNCVRFPHALAPPDPYGDFTEGRYGFLLTLLKRLDRPILATGHQGIWNWTIPNGHTEEYELTDERLKEIANQIRELGRPLA